MLNDLEKRDAFLHEKQDFVLDGLYSAYDLELEQKKKMGPSTLVLISIITVVSIVLLSVYMYLNDAEQYLVEFNNEKHTEELHSLTDDNDKKENELSNKIENDITNDTDRFLKLDDNLLINGIFAKDGQVESKSLNLIKEIFFDTNEQGINLVMKMPEDIDYLVYGLNKPNRIVIEVSDAELGILIEDLEPIEPIVAIRYSINENNRFKLVLETDQPLTIRKTTASSNNGLNDLVIAMDYRWQNGFVAKNENNESENIINEIVDNQANLEQETVFKGELVKTPINENVNAYAEKLFREGYKNFKNGAISKSLKKLNMALDQDSSHINARSTLATVLSKQGHIELAYSVLNEGLIQYPEQTEWLKVYARLLLSEGKFVEANARLEKNSPTLSSNAEYYALKAAILQKLNEHNKSAKIYRDLLQLNPAKSVWWMGLGISLESLKRYEDALYAYQKASTNTSLANESRSFINQRISRLTNLLKDESS